MGQFAVVVDEGGTRAAGALASAFHARARTATIRNQLINLPGRLAPSARRLLLHLPRDWPWEHPAGNYSTGRCTPRPAPA